MAKVLSFLLLATGLLLVVCGAIFILIYFKDAVFLRIEEADQSLLFWYLPFLFVSLGSLISGVVIGQTGLRRLRLKTETTKSKQTSCTE